MKNKKLKKGFTLIEVVVVMALMGIVASLAFNLYFFGHQTYYTEEKQSDVQSEIRIVTDYIVNTARNSTELEIIDYSSIDITSTEYNYIYFDGVDSVNCHFTDGSDIVIGNNVKTLSFYIVNSNTLGISVSSERNANNYSSTVNLNLINIGLNEDSIGAPDGTGNKIAFRFKLPA